jgi:SHS2 domain-containing protein
VSSARGKCSYSYFDHDADVGVVGRGDTLELAFEAAARAMFAIMTDISTVRPQKSVPVEFEEADPELALARWLNLLLATAREHGMVFGAFSVAREGGRWRGAAGGETWRPAHERGVEVKGATLTALSVRQVPGGWEARCVVDV